MEDKLTSSAALKHHSGMSDALDDRSCTLEYIDPIDRKKRLSVKARFVFQRCRVLLAARLNALPFEGFRFEPVPHRRHRQWSCLS